MTADLALAERRRRRVADRLGNWRGLLGAPVPTVAEGRLVRMVGMTLEAVGCRVPVGGRCRIVGDAHAPIDAEVVGFSGDRTFLMPVGHVTGLTPNARVRPTASALGLAVGEGLLGRVIDPLGAPLDGLPEPQCTASAPLLGRQINPLLRSPISEPLDVGVRAVNGLLTVGRGQRVGLFAGSGVGKSTLLGMLARYTGADVVVVGLIGERGREVSDFITDTLGADGLARAVVIAAPADAPPLLRLQGALAATAVAEHFRDQGRHVLLLMDSLTRFAQAQREIGLAIGEPPVTRGYTPSVFARLPQLLERAGTCTRSGGSITGIYTVLVEGDYEQDPIADAARAVLDGHIVLARAIAEAGRFPAIDVEASISRVMNRVVSAEHLAGAQQFRSVLAAYEQHRDLISVGAYREGTDPRVDRAIALLPKLHAYLAQPEQQSVSFADSAAALRALLEGA